MSPEILLILAYFCMQLYILTFWDSLEYARRIIFNCRFAIQSLSFEWFFEFWKQPKVKGGYVGTVRRLSKQCDTVITQKLLHKIR